MGRTVPPRSLGESLADVDPNTPAHRRTRARRARRVKLLFHNGVRAAGCAPPPGLELRAESDENKYLNAGWSADGLCNESLFSSLPETIAKPFFPSLLEAHLMGDSFSGRDKAVQCYLADQHDVDRVKKLTAGIKERDEQITQLVGSGGNRTIGIYVNSGGNNAVPLGVPVNPTYPSGCTVGQVRRSLWMAVSEGVNPPPWRGTVGQVSSQRRRVRRMWSTQAVRRSERSNSVLLFSARSLRRATRSASAHAEQHISTNDKYQDDLVSDIDEF